MTRYERGAIRRRLRAVWRDLRHSVDVAEVLGLDFEEVRAAGSRYRRPSDELVRRVGTALSIAIGAGRLVECRYRGRQRWERGEL